MPNATIICRSLNGVPSIKAAHNPKSPSGRSISSFNFARAGFDEVLAHRRLLDPVGGGKLLHHRPES